MDVCKRKKLTIIELIRLKLVFEKFNFHYDVVIKRVNCNYKIVYVLFISRINFDDHEYLTFTFLIIVYLDSIYLFG